MKERHLLVLSVETCWPRQEYYLIQIFFWCLSLSVYVLLVIILCFLLYTTTSNSPLLPYNWIIHHHNQCLTFCISLVTQETQTQLLLCPRGVEWSEAASGCGALWGWIPAALCPGEGGNCQDTHSWAPAAQGALPGHPQDSTKRLEGRNEDAFMVLTLAGLTVLEGLQRSYG